MGKTDKSYKAPGTGTAPSAVVGQVGSALKAQSTPLKTGKLSVPSSAVSNQHVKLGMRRRTNTKGILPNPKTVGQRMEKKILIKKMMRPESLR